MDLTSFVKDGCTVLELYGQLDRHNADGVAEWMQQAAAVNPDYVIVDLLDTDILDTAALNELSRGIEAIIHTDEPCTLDWMVKEQVDEPEVVVTR